MDVNDVMEIVRESPLKRLPTTPDQVEGLMNHRGRLIPVIQLARLFDATKMADGISRILIVCHHDRTLGLLVDDVERVAVWPEEAVISEDHSLNHVSDISFLLDETRYHRLRAELLIGGMDAALSP